MSLSSPKFAQFWRTEPVNYQQRDGELFANDWVFKPKVPQIVTLKNMLINDEMLVFYRLGFDPNSFLYREYYKPSRWNALKFLIKQNCKRAVLVPKGIWITDAWSNGYFHWFGDVLQKLFLIRKEIDLRNYRLILPAHFRSLDMAMISLDLLDIPIHFIEKGELVKCAELLTFHEFPVSGNYFDPIMREISVFFRGKMDQIVNHFNYPLVYISRRKATRRKVLNEEQVTGLFLKHGFSVLYMEDHSWEKQVALIKNTKVLASIHGAGLTNMLFLQPGSSIIEFRHSLSSKQNCFFSLSSALEHKYYYLIGKTDKADAHEADLVIDINELDELIYRTIRECKEP